MGISATELLGIVAIRGADEGALKLLAVGGAADSAGAKLAGLAVGGTVLASAGLIALGVAAVKMDADLQQGINRLKTGGGDIQDTFTSLRTGIQSVAVATGTLTGPLTQAMYLIVSSGQRGAQAMDTLKVASEGAQIEQANVVDVANTLSGVMTNYGEHTHTATQYMNGLIEAVKHGKITLQDLATAMGPIDPVAHDLGISMNDVAAAMTTQTNAMVPAARAATGLRFLFQSLENPTKKASTAMKEWGVNSIALGDELKVSLPGALQMVYDAAKRAGPEGSVPFNRAISDMIGGQRSLTAFMALTGSHMQDFVANSKLIGDAMGANTNQVTGWDTAQSNLNVQLEQGQAFLQVMGQNIGDVLLPYVSQLLSFVLPLGEGFATWATSTQGLAGDINQLAAFISYLYQDVQANGALQEFGSILSDIGSTVSNVVNAALSTLGQIFGTTASQAGQASDAATNVANGFKRVLDTVKPLTDLLSWLSSQFADAGVKGQILRDVLITIGGAIAGIKIAEFAPGFITAMTNAATATKGFGLQLAGLQTQADATATSVKGVGVATTGAASAETAAATNAGSLKTSFADLGLAMGPIIGIATGVALALQALPPIAGGVQLGFHNLGEQLQAFTLGGVVQRVQDGNQIIQQQTQQMQLIASRNFDSMYQNASNSTIQLKSGVTIALNQLKDGTTESVGSMDQYVQQKMADMGSGSQNYVRNMHDQIVNDFFNMHKQVYTETQTMSSQALTDFQQLNGDLTEQMASTDANVIGYWNDIANYISNNPIDGYVNISVAGTPAPKSATVRAYATGTDYAPGGASWVGEGGSAELVIGPHLMNLPRGAGVYPLSQVGSGSGVSGSPVQVNIYLAGQRVESVLLPGLVTAIRNATGARF